MKARTHGRLVFDEGARATRWGRGSPSFHKCWQNQIPRVKTDSKCTGHRDARPRAVEVLEANGETPWRRARPLPGHQGGGCGVRWADAALTLGSALSESLGASAVGTGTEQRGWPDGSGPGERWPLPESSAVVVGGARVWWGPSEQPSLCGPLPPGLLGGSLPATERARGVSVLTRDSFSSAPPAGSPSLSPTTPGPTEPSLFFCFMLQ